MPAIVTQALERFLLPPHIVPIKASKTKAPKTADKTIPAAAPRLLIKIRGKSE